jgi:hypothetical protein
LQRIFAPQKQYFFINGILDNLVKELNTTTESSKPNGLCNTEQSVQRELKNYGTINLNSITFFILLFSGFTLRIRPQQKKSKQERI